jgi:pimeloyl-ACP methyl ester carboxylesterase
MFEPVEIAQDVHATRAPDQRTGQATQAASAAPIVVTLVHGTFAKGAPWTKDGSILRREIAAELGRQEHDVIFDVFEWSGRNTHKARIKAGSQLADHIRELKKRYPLSKHFIVAHSHGGNVALLAHKHLPQNLHATGVTTLGTPFLYAQLPEELASADDQALRDIAKGGAVLRTIGMYLAIFAGIAITYLLDEYFKKQNYDGILIAFGAGITTWLLLHKRASALLAWLLHPISPRRAAVRLGQALALKPMPATHVLSFVYPGDEAGLLLNTLEKTTALPTMAVRWFKPIASSIVRAAYAITFMMALLSGAIAYLTGISDEMLESVVVGTGSGILLAGVGGWLSLLGIRYMLSFLRGHPAGFGWERPSIHAHVDIGVTPVADVPGAKSNAHQEVPFTIADDAKRGLRHSGLYEDTRILKALAYWMAHVR